MFTARLSGSVAVRPSSPCVHGESNGWHIYNRSGLDLGPAFNICEHVTVSILFYFPEPQIFQLVRGWIIILNALLGFVKTLYDNSHKLLSRAQHKVNNLEANQ